MRERDLARPRAQSAADQRWHARRMVRAAERPHVGERAAFEHAGDRGDHRDFEQLRRRERRQDRGQPRREHRLAGAGRADHQEIVPAGRRDLERALGALLALDVLEIDKRAVDLADLRLWAREHLRAAEMIGELDEGRRGDDVHLRARPGGFRAADGRTDQPFAARIRPDRSRQHAGDRCDRAVEPELAEHGMAGEGIGRDGADRRHQAERDREIVVAALLRQVGGREIDGNAARRQREPRGDERGAYALACFAHCLVGKADDVNAVI